MTILSVDEIWSGETASDEETGAQTFEKQYRIISDSPTESSLNVKNALPAQGSVFPAYPAAVVVDRNVNRIAESREVWEATVTYEFNPDDPDEPQEDPTAEPAKIRWTSQLELEPIYQDRNGNAIVNSAGDYFDPPIEFDIAKWEVNVQKNVSSVPLDFLSWAGAIISTSYTVDGVSVEANKSRIVGAEISEYQEKNSIGYRTVTLGIKFYREEVKIRPLDQGFRFKDGSTLKDILVEDEDGNKQRPSSPVLLDGAGGVLADPGPTNAEFLEFDPPVDEVNPVVLPLS